MSGWIETASSAQQEARDAVSVKGMLHIDHDAV